MVAEAEDGQSPSTVTDHIFTPPAGQPWARCAICKLSEAAHTRTGSLYRSATAVYRCPYCVDLETDPCRHGRQRALDLKGEPLGGGV